MHTENFVVWFLPSSNIDNRNGLYVYCNFYDVVVLKEINWLDESDPDGVIFNTVLELVREGKMTEDDRNISIEKCIMFNMGIQEFKIRGFDDDSVSWLFCTNKDAENYNNFQIANLQKSGRFIAKITVEK